MLRLGPLWQSLKMQVGHGSALRMHSATRALLSLRGKTPSTQAADESMQSQAAHEAAHEATHEAAHVARGQAARNVQPRRLTSIPAAAPVVIAATPVVTIAWPVITLAIWVVHVPVLAS